MEELGSSGSHFHGNLDPRAQEFRPLNSVNNLTQITIYTPPPQLFYPYAIPPPPPPPPLPLYPRNYFQLFPYSDSGPGYYGSLQFIAPPLNHKGYLAEPNHPPPSVSPTRALVLSLLPAGVSESLLRRELEVYGEVRGVQMERIHDGIVTVHFYDLRHAERALNEIREVYMQQQQQQQSRLTNPPFNNSPYCCGSSVEGEFTGNYSLQPRQAAEGLVSGRVIWAHFVVPASNSVPGGNNQGSLVVFNLDPDVPSHALNQTFQAYGPVKEMRETPYKKNQKFVEFFDIRDAAKALDDLNGKEIYGHRVVIQFSRPGGLVKKFMNANYQSSITDPRSTFTNTTTLVNLPTGFRSSRYQPPPPPPPPPPPSGRSNSSSRSPRSYNSRYHSVGKKGNPNFNKFSTDDPIPSLSVMNIRSIQGEIPVVKRRSPNYHSINKNHNDDHSSRDNRPWRSKHSRTLDPRFLIQEDAPVDSNCKDSRTTVMIKNIPNKYSQKLLLNMLDNHCINCNEHLNSHGDGEEDDDQPLSSYDFVYLPIDFSNKCNVGYGFVNMTSPQATLRLYKAFHLQHWEVFNSRKICEVTYARVQGLEALKEHFKNSKFPCEVGHYLPVVFSPPRDGKQLTEPLPIVGYKQKQQQPITGNGEAEEEEEEVGWGNGNHDDSCVECGSEHGGPEDEGTGGSCSNTCTTITCSSSSIGCCYQNDDDDED